MPQTPLRRSDGPLAGEPSLKEQEFTTMRFVDPSCAGSHVPGKIRPSSINSPIPGTRSADTRDFPATRLHRGQAVHLYMDFLVSTRWANDPDQGTKALVNTSARGDGAEIRVAWGTGTSATLSRAPLKFGIHLG